MSDSVENPWDGFVVIHTYTRAEAIEDGVLVDVSETAREAGIKIPCAVTSAVWINYVEPPPIVSGQSAAGRLWDVLWMFRVAAMRDENRDMEAMLYPVLVQNDERLPAQEVTLKAHCGPGDNGEPVITIMLPGED